MIELFGWCMMRKEEFERRTERAKKDLCRYWGAMRRLY